MPYDVLLFREFHRHYGTYDNLPSLSPFVRINFLYFLCFILLSLSFQESSSQKFLHNYFRLSFLLLSTIVELDFFVFKSAKLFSILAWRLISKQSLAIEQS